MSELNSELMSEENEALEYFKNKQVYDMELVFNYIPILLNIIEGLQTKVNTGIEIIKELKEIEKSHKEENGKLKVELDELEKTLKQTQDSWFEDTQKIEQLKLNGKVKNTGKLVKNKIDGTIGIVLREWETGQIQVLEKIQPKVINTHDSWDTLELLEEK